MKLTDVRGALKKNSMFFFTYKKLTDNDYRSAYLDYLFRKNIKPREKIRAEMSLIRDYWKCDPMLYFRYRLYEKHLTPEELLDYIPPYYFYNFYMPSIYTKEHIELTASKLGMNRFFLSKGIDTPAIRATVTNGIISDPTGKILDVGSLRLKLLQSGCTTHFFKPDDGRGGKGIMKIERVGNELFINNDFLSESLLKSITKGITYVVQQGIKQRDDLGCIYPNSVNTLRVITQNFKGSPGIVAVILRMGRNGSYVDNSSFGGVFAPVDLETGKISKEAYLLHDSARFTVHPDTGYPFSDFSIMGWEKIKQDVLGFVSRASEFPDIAWDIAVLEDKIMAIEINLNYGLDQLQCAIGGMRRRLNITPSLEYLKAGKKMYFLRP